MKQKSFGMPRACDPAADLVVALRDVVDAADAGDFAKRGDDRVGDHGTTVEAVDLGRDNAGRIVLAEDCVEPLAAFLVTAELGKPGDEEDVAALRAEHSPHDLAGETPSTLVVWPDIVVRRAERQVGREGDHRDARRQLAQGLDGCGVGRARR